METLQTIFWGMAGICKHLAKSLYRNGAIVMAGMFVVAVVSFNSKDFSAGGKNHVAHVASTQEKLSETQESSDEEADVVEGFQFLSGASQQDIEVSQINIEAAVECSKKITVESPQFTVSDASPSDKEEADLVEQVREKQTKAASKDTASVESASVKLVSSKQMQQREIELNDADYEALLRIVEAEATGESMEGKMLVANVVLNRVENDLFPDSVVGVVFDKRGGRSQFSPVRDGRYYSVTISDETVEAVERVLCGEDESQNALFFAARKYADPDNMEWFDENLQYLYTCGGHEFFTLK